MVAPYNQVAASGTYNMYVGREPRFYLTVMWNRQWYHQAEREVQMMSNEQDGGPTHDAPQNGYLNRKNVSLDQTSVTVFIRIVRYPLPFGRGLSELCRGLE